MSGVKTKEQLFSHVTGLDPSVHTATMLERIQTKGPTETMATAQDLDEIPEHVKPISYPFDYAWNKMHEQKLSTTAPPSAADIDVPMPAN